MYPICAWLQIWYYVEAGDAQVDEFRRAFVSRLDKAAKVGVIPANRAARKKSQADKLAVAK